VILSKKEAKSSFDFIFIDAWFTFDTTLIDIILADKLLHVGGILVIDNYLHNTITTLMDNIIKNWTHYKQIESPPTSIAFKKVAEGIQTFDFKVTF
jgi:predicted O-methyltransferase YrrM